MVAATTTGHMDKVMARIDTTVTVSGYYFVNWIKVTPAKHNSDANTTILQWHYKNRTFISFDLFY